MHAPDVRSVLPVLEMARQSSLAEQAADAIVTGVASGALQPGQRLVEADLAGLLNMSRVPLREALKILEVQGIVESVPHRGTRVAPIDHRRLDQISEVRVALERFACRDAIPIYVAQPGELAKLDRLIHQMERAASRIDWIDVSRADLAFHREIMRVSGNVIVQTLWEGLSRLIFIQFGLEILEERDTLAYGPMHRKLRDLLAAGDGAALDREIADHVFRLRRGPQVSNKSPDHDAG